jgi:uncharacterized protein YcaQ
MTAVPAELSRDDVRRLLVTHLALSKPVGRGVTGTRRLLERLRCIQLDPLDVIGTNADLVVMARVEDVRRGDVWRHLFPHHAFEHFAKERCILPADAFPRYRAQGHAAQTPWWRHSERQQRIPQQLVEAVRDEIRERGPLTARDLTDHGKVAPIDWSGWKGTSKATSMALEILWTQCDIVVAGRTESGAKLYDVPERSFGSQPSPEGDFARWALLERVDAAGLLSRASGSMWSMLSTVRTSGLVDELLEAGELVEVTVEGSSRRYLARPKFLRQRRAEYDDRIRILGPLDPLLWDRNLIRDAFAFDYVWEVYKPESQRKWGWYVCPLLHRDRLVGRLDARIEGSRLVVRKLWMEDGFADLDVRPTLERHGLLCGATSVRLPRSRSR